MSLRNGAHGYGAVTKLLHWSTVAAIIAQFVVGYSVRGELDHHGGGRGGGGGGHDALAALDHGHGGSGAGDGGGEEGFEKLFSGGFGLPELHVVLGLTILALGALRVTWRFAGSLPPWADALSSGERTLEGWLEKALLTLLFVIPLTGLLLIGTGENDYLPVHVAAHIAFFVVVGVHVGLVLKHTVIQRDRHLARMW